MAAPGEIGEVSCRKNLKFSSCKINPKTFYGQGIWGHGDNPAGTIPGGRLGVWGCLEKGEFFRVKLQDVEGELC